LVFELDNITRRSGCNVRIKSPAKNLHKVRCLLNFGDHKMTIWEFGYVSCKINVKF
jgi:hypothetical protein